jgi:bifunctional non-homologous end joining protein LigD
MAETKRPRVAAKKTADGASRKSTPAPAAVPAVEIPAGKDALLAIGDRQVRLTNLDKPFWPELGIVKRELLQYYADVAPVLLPHLADRAMVMKRYPDGAAGEPFFMKRAPSPRPEWIETCAITHGSGSVIDFPVIQDLASLLWVVNLGCIDLNPWQSLAEAPDTPTHVLFDLDPADGLPFGKVVEAAGLVRRAIEELGLRGYPRTSGASGMHIMVPLVPRHDFDEVRLVARGVSEGLVTVRPDLVTTVTRVADRGPRVYLDANQNGRGRSIASVYSVRPRPGAPVATPLDWDEVVPGLDPREFTMGEVARRLERHGDLAAPLLEDLQELDGAITALAG